MNDEKLHKLLEEPIVVSNDYINELNDKYYNAAKFLLENNYPVNTTDVTALADFLRTQDKKKEENESNNPM